MVQPLEFEKPIAALDAQIAELAAISPAQLKADRRAKFLAFARAA